MKEHKFKAWDKRQKKWFGANLHISVTDGLLWWQFGYKCEILSAEERENIELVEYTGLKDKNGRKIYEGDIIKLSNSTDSTIFGNEIGVVEFMENRVCWYLNTGEFNDWTQLNREIIGNIYENPEFLSKK